MTLLTLIIAAVLLAAGVALLVALILGIENRAIDRAGDRFDYGLTDDDAPRDDNDWPVDDPESFEAWMRKKYGITP